MESIEQLIKTVEELVNHERYEDAIEILENLYKDNPDSKKVKESLLKTLFIYGGYLNDDYTSEYDKAKDIFKKIIEIDSSNYRAQYNLGIAYFNLHEMEKAKECYEEAVRLKPDYKHCIYNLGLIYENEGNLQEALKYYEKALEIDPKFLYALNARVHILSNIDNLKRSNNNISNQRKNIEQFKSLLEVSKTIRIVMIQELLNIEKNKLLDLLIEWCKKYRFEIDGDFLKINKERLPEFFKFLDDWEN